MILRAEDLVKLLNISETDIDVSGLKLTVFKIYRVKGKGIISLDSKEIPSYEEVPLVANKLYTLQQGAYVVRYAEEVRIPEDCIALAFPRSSLLRMGATLHTAVWDPGYRGRGIGLLVVYNPYGIIIEKGAQIGQLIFIKMVGKIKRLYSGTYQGER